MSPFKHTLLLWKTVGIQLSASPRRSPVHTMFDTTNGQHCLAKQTLPAVQNYTAEKKRTA